MNVDAAGWALITTLVLLTICAFGVGIILGARLLGAGKRAWTMARRVLSGLTGSRIIIVMGTPRCPLCKRAMALGDDGEWRCGDSSHLSPVEGGKLHG